MMERRTFLGAIADGLLAAPLAAHAQQAGKMARIAVLGATRPEDLPPWEGFRQGLRERGYVEGQNIAIDYRWAEGRFERLPALAAELAGLKPAVIVAFVTQSSVAARKATSTIPIVMVAVADPIGAGLVTSLARPGGNVTGNSSVSVEVTGKSLDLLKEVAPERRRVAVLWNPANAVLQNQMVREAEAASRRLGLQVQTTAARDASEIDKAFQLMTRGRAETLAVLTRYSSPRAPRSSPSPKRAVCLR
jgi:putative tryptophan/tyrosine transport system substrate-binding protein